MQKKKSPKADLQSKRLLFFQAGIIVALAAAVAVFSMGISEKNYNDYTLPGIHVDTDMVYVPVTKEQPREAKGVAKVITTFEIWNIVDDLTPPRKILNAMPGIEDIFEAPDPEPVRFEKPDVDTIFVVSEDMPRFMGGDIETFRRWVMANIEYPEQALRHGITGRVRVEFVIGRDGRVTDVEVVGNPDRALSDAAVKVIEGSPAWEPGKQRNKPVRVRFNMPVDFRISQ